MIQIAILDLGINNLTSIKQALSDFSDVKVTVLTDKSEYTSADLVVLPGVGSFGVAMESIKSRGFDSLISTLNEEKIKISGICLGMQLMCSASEESPGVNGLGLFKLKVDKLPLNAGEKVPHMGWNSVNFKLIDDLPFPPTQSDFYFVHSYAVLGESEFTLATSNFGTEMISSALVSQNIAGFQFHPEKSSTAGMQLLKNLIMWANA